MNTPSQALGFRTPGHAAACPGRTEHVPNTPRDASEIPFMVTFEE